MFVAMIFCLMFEGGPVVFSDTGLFRPIGQAEVAVNPAGDLFVVNFDEALVLHYDQTGKRLDNIGKKGQGPGEFQNPTRVWWSDDKLWVLDLGANKINVYSGKGTFLKDHKMEGIAQDVVRVANGWLLNNARFSMDPKAPVEFRLANSDMSDIRTILSYPRPETEGGMRIEIGNGQVPKIKFNPAREMFNIAVSSDGRFAYVSFPGKLKIEKIDILAGKVVETLTRDLGRVAFNEAWGKAELQKSQDSQRSMKIEMEPNFPDFFPLVRSISTGPNDTLVVNRFSADPDTVPLVLVMDGNGKDANLPYRPENHQRVLALIGESAMISTFSEDEAGLALIPFSKVDEFIAANPIHFEGSINRFIMRMN